MAIADAKQYRQIADNVREQQTNSRCNVDKLGESLKKLSVEWASREEVFAAVCLTACLASACSRHAHVLKLAVLLRDVQTLRGKDDSIADLKNQLKNAYVTSRGIVAPSECMHPAPWLIAVGGAFGDGWGTE
jgi:hypothetical protein